MLIRTLGMVAVLVVTGAVSSMAARIPGLQPGPVELQSAGPLAFAESGVLLVGDAKAATVYAVDTQDESVDADQPLEIKDLHKALAQELEADPASVTIADMAVNPDTGNVFLSLSAGDQPALVKIAADASITVLDLNQVDHAKKVMPSPPKDEEVQQGRRRGNPRNDAITDIAYLDGRVMVSGLSVGDAPSSVIEFPFPFAENTVLTKVEIFHGAHGRVESPAIRAFVPFTIDGEPSLLAGFTCTPLVKFPINQLEGGEKVRGTTIAELGNRNQPLDMVVYEQDGKRFVLMSNSARGTMKISTEDIASNPGLSERVEGGGTAGQPFETIDSLAGVVQMDKLDDAHAIVIVGADDQPATLKVIELP